MTRPISFDGTRLSMRTYGPPDAPLVALVHGLILSTNSWGAVPERLADRHRVVYDLRWPVTPGAPGRVGRRIRRLEPAANRPVRRSASVEGERPGLVGRLRQNLLRSRPVELTLAALAGVADGGIRLARRAAAPTLVLHGTAEAELPQRRIDRLLDALPDARLVQVPRAGSMLPLTHGDLVAEEIARWIRLLGQPPSAQPAVGKGAPSTGTLSVRGR